MQISLVPAQDVDKYWSALSQGFHRAVMKTGGDITIGELWQGVREGRTFLIIAHGTEIHGASIWVPTIWQTGPKLRCLALYGRGMKHWIADMHDMAKRIATDCGATSLVSEGREGWAKIFPNARKVRILYEEQL